jgi:hypothetical protein
MLNSLFTGGLAALLLHVTTVAAAAGAMTPVSDWAKGPTKVNMYIHVPKKLAPKPPIIVMVHALSPAIQQY